MTYTTQQLKDLINAHESGKTLQFQTCDGRWEDGNPMTGWTLPVNWRVKPEPREWWLNDIGVAYGSYDAALPMTTYPKQPIHVREVL